MSYATAKRYKSNFVNKTPLKNHLKGSKKRKLSKRVLDQIKKNLIKKDNTVKKVAKKINVSESTLKRRLNDDPRLSGLKFKRIASKMGKMTKKNLD